MIEDIVNVERMQYAEDGDYEYLNYVLCGNGKDIVIRRYYDHGSHWSVALYSDRTDMIEEECYPRIDFDLACEVIVDLFESNRKMYKTVIEL